MSPSSGKQLDDGTSLVWVYLGVVRRVVSEITKMKRSMTRNIPSVGPKGNLK